MKGGFHLELYNKAPDNICDEERGESKIRRMPLRLQQSLDKGQKNNTTYHVVL